MGFSAAPVLSPRRAGGAPPIATAVLAGSKSLDEAYHDVQVATGKINNDTIRPAAVWVAGLFCCPPLIKCDSHSIISSPNDLAREP